MNRREVFRRLLGLGSAVAVAPVVAKIAEAMPEPVKPLPVFPPVSIPSVWVSDASVVAASATWTASNGNNVVGNYVYANGQTPCFEAKGGRLVFKGYTEDMDCPFPPEDWP